MQEKNGSGIVKISILGKIFPLDEALNGGVTRASAGL
jgi:hypothetical protein